MDSMLDEYYKGNGRGWPGERVYRSGYSSLLRWQELMISKLTDE